MIIKEFKGVSPKLTGSYLAETATVIGDVTVEPEASVWYGAVLRGDEGSITVGARTSIQDNAVLHNTTGVPCVVGKDCVVGHNAILHSCTIGDGCLIGIGSIILDRAVIGEKCIIAAGALVPPRTVIPPYSMVMGVPGKVVKTLTDKDLEHTVWSIQEYIDLSEEELEKQSYPRSAEKPFLKWE